MTRNRILLEVVLMAAGIGFVFLLFARADLIFGH